MTKILFITLPVTDLSASTAFCKALGFSLNPQFSGEDGPCPKPPQSGRPALSGAF